MTTLSATYVLNGRPTLARMLGQAWQSNRLLTLAGLLHLALITLLLVAWFFDPQTILGQPAWIKPLKFAISGGIYLFTFAWLLRFVQGWPRFKRFAAAATAVALTVEIALITMQVLRGTVSHFNQATPFDSTVFRVMGGFVVLIAVLNLALAIFLFVQRLPDPVLAWGLRLGVLSAFAGMMVAVLMTTGPTPAQRARMEAGERVTYVGGHSVGVEDGGPGLPLLGWSTTGGDLRVPHFVGLHGLQLLPLVGWLLTLPGMRRRISSRHRQLLVWTAGLGYFGLTALLTWQALRGQSLIAPDSTTWVALITLVGSVVVAAGAIWLHGQRRADTAWVTR